jgi:hypothetical protein
LASSVSNKLRPSPCLACSALRWRLASSSFCATSHSLLLSMGASVVPPETKPEDMVLLLKDVDDLVGGKLRRCRSVNNWDSSCVCIGKWGGPIMQRHWGLPSSQRQTLRSFYKLVTDVKDAMIQALLFIGTVGVTDHTNEKSQNFSDKTSE